MNALRRYEILLPSQFNDGRSIPQERLAETLTELEERFRAVSCETRSFTVFGGRKVKFIGTV